jgi:hypothetical protein
MRARCPTNTDLLSASPKKTDLLSASPKKKVFTFTRLGTTVTRDDGTVVLDGTAVCYTMDIATGIER